MVQGPFAFCFSFCFFSMLSLSWDWKVLLEEECKKEYFLALSSFLEKEISQNKKIFPPVSEIFWAFDLCSFDDVKVVILWQDPYHGPWQAMWLSFSVPVWVKKPPSLLNIFKELRNDIGCAIPDCWDLSDRARQWVFLLNSILTVEASLAASHRCQWREKFTDAVISLLSTKKEWVIFLLWWSHAQSKRVLIDEKKHSVLCCVHPSPLSAYRWWFGSKPFSQTNDLLVSYGHEPIHWCLSC